MTAVRVPGIVEEGFDAPRLRVITDHDALNDTSAGSGGGSSGATVAEITEFVPEASGLLAASSLQRGLKRVVDALGAAVLLLALVPILLVVAVLVAATSRGPVLYRQTRVGRDGQPFQFLKFRTMREDSDVVREQLVDDNEAAGPVFKIKHDPRITPVGRVLRKLSIDELPQLLHVLGGTMSLVGPRPPMPGEVEQYSARERQRLLVKPGLTCIWQVSGRSDIGFDRWVEMDLAYIREWTPTLDLRILLATVPAVLTGRGAY